MFERKKALYNLLLDNIGKGYLTRDEICNALPQFYPRYAENGIDKYASTAYNNMRADIDEMQRDYYFEKVIVSNGSSYKLAETPNEVENEISKIEYAGYRKLTKAASMRYKLQKDNQLKDDEGNLRFVEVLGNGRD